MSRLQYAAVMVGIGLLGSIAFLADKRLAKDPVADQKELEAEQAIALVNSKTLGDCLYERVTIPQGWGSASMHVIRCPNSSVSVTSQEKNPVTTVTVDNRGKE